MKTNTKLAVRRPADPPTYRAIDRSIQALTTELQQGRLRMPKTTSARIKRLVRIYEGVEPMLEVVGTLRLIPTNWRRVLSLFNEALGSVAADIDELATPDFQAGKGP